MGVGFKSPVTSNNVNTAFLSKNVDDETFKNIALKDPTKGANVASIQQAINDGIESLDLHVTDYEAHREFDTKANLDTWALTADNGWLAFATDENKSYQVIDAALAEIGGGGGGLNKWETLTEYVVGDVIWLEADYKIYVCITDNTDATFTPAKWTELSAGVSELSELTDVDVFTREKGEFLRYDGTNWKNKKVAQDASQLFYVDFENELPSTYFSNVSASLLIVDDGVNPLIQDTTAKITQSSAISGDGFEKVIELFSARGDWYLKPIKLIIDSEILGGSGTFKTIVSKSIDGVTYTNVATDLPLTNGSLSENKLILQLDSTVTHVKVRTEVLNPDDATVLRIGRIAFYNDAFPVGQTVEKQNLQTTLGSSFTNGGLNVPSGTSGYSIEYLSVSTITGASILNFTNVSGYTVARATKKCTVTVSMQLLSTAANNTIRIFDADSVTLKSQNDNAYSSGAAMNLSSTLELESGEAFIINPSSYSNPYAGARIEINATAYADNVIVDAATSGLNTQSYNPVIEGFGTPTGVDFTWSRLLGDKILVQGKFTSGTPTAVEARVGLPNFFTVKGGSNKIAGEMPRSASSVIPATVIYSNGEQYFKVGNGDYNPTVPSNGNAILTPGETVFFTAIVPVNELDMSSQLIQLDVSSERENVYSARIANNGTVSIKSQSANAFKSPVRLSAGLTTLDISNLGLTQAPAVTGSTLSIANPAVKVFEVISVSTTSITVETGYADSGVHGVADYDYEIFIQRQGADYRPQKAFVANAVSLQPTAYISHTTAVDIASSANTVHTRSLTQLDDISNIVKNLSSNQFTLGDGSYEFDIDTIYYSASGAHTRSYLYNVTDSAYVLESDKLYATGTTIRPRITGRLVLTSSKVFEVRQWSQGANTVGLSATASALTNDPSGATQRVVRVMIRKIK